MAKKKWFKRVSPIGRKQLPSNVRDTNGRQQMIGGMPATFPLSLEDIRAPVDPGILPRHSGGYEGYCDGSYSGDPYMLEKRIWMVLPPPSSLTIPMGPGNVAIVSPYARYQPPTNSRGVNAPIRMKAGPGRRKIVAPRAY